MGKPSGDWYSNGKGGGRYEGGDRYQRGDGDRYDRHQKGDSDRYSKGENDRYSRAENDRHFKGDGDRGYKGDYDRYRNDNDRGYKGEDNRYSKGADDRGYKKGDKGNDKAGDRGSGKGDRGKDKGKGKGFREERVVDRALRGKVISFVSKKPSGFIKRMDGKSDVYFDFAEVEDEERVDIGDPVEFDVVEGGQDRLYATRVKKLPKDTQLVEERPAPAASAGKLSLDVTASKAGSLTANPMMMRLGASQPGSLTAAPLSLRPSGGLTLGPNGGFGGALAESKKPDTKATEQDDGDEEEDRLFGRIVLVQVRSAYGFLQPLGSSTDQDIFFRAADVIGMNCNEPGEDGVGLQITLSSGRNSHGYKTFSLGVDDEVSYKMAKDHTGKSCATGIRKERRGTWRAARDQRPTGGSKKRESLKDQVKRLLEMDTDQVLQNASLLKEVLEHPDFDPSHLYKIVGLLAAPELAEDTRADPLYRLFLDSRKMQASLRTIIIRQSSGAKHSGTFLEDCLRLIVEIVCRSPCPADLRGQLPLVEVVEALELSVREGATLTRKGLPEEIVQMLKCLHKHFPDEVHLTRVLGARAPKANRTAAEDYTELMEADDYRDMPILPTSEEMLGQCAFEIQENMRTYEKCEDYIQTHFMLLREDYIEPLRAGIKLFMEGRHSPKDLHVYTGVKVVGMLSTMEGLVYRVELKKEQIRRVNWDKTKQLMYGSLLCLSDDNFETLVWATVWRRDEHLISTEAQLDIRLPFDPFDDRLSPGKTFCCIENVTIYFEAYRHVLIALQNMRPTDVPFQHTLLNPQPDPMPPAFLKAENDMWHFHNVFHSCQKADAKEAVKSFKILQDWPESLRESLDIDSSQLDAIKHGLTHNLALIQGPPGTGKTWVGLKIMQALLDNTGSQRHSPILVVCFTNHALDQFLEGIYKFCGRVARIGSRSKSEQMKDRNLKELVAEIQPSREFFQARRALIDRRDTIREQLAKTLRDVDKHVVELEDAQSLMTEDQFEQFFEGYIDYRGGDMRGLPKDAWGVDEECWEKMMKAWLDINDLSKPAAQMIPKSSGGLQSQKQGAGDGPLAYADIADDAEEEEADAERHDRQLDVEAKDMVENREDNKKPLTDFQMDLNNAWLPFEDDYLETLRSSEQRSLVWREERLWLLPVSLRRETYRRWLLETHHEARELLPELARQLERNAENRAALERDRKLAVLREMDVVGMTTTAVSKYQLLLKELRPEVVIVEEAAEVLEAHILTALHPRTQHVVLIGDHQQLRPSTAVYRLSKNFHLDVSLFERLIRNGAAHVTLQQQRRMHPSISRLMKPLYPQLRDHSSVSEYPEVMGVDARTFFLSHSNFEDDEGESHSKANTFEAEFIVALAAHLVHSGYSESQITVLSPYLGQVRLLRNKLRRHAETEGVQITAVDNFQGEENDIIVISLVRSNRNRTMGFLAVENRINVALTRARHGMFIVGNSDMLKGHKLWSSIIDDLRSDNSISDRMPLIELESGGIFQAGNADDISVLLDDPLFASGGGHGGNDGRDVADRWADLGKEDKPKGKGRNDKGSGKGADSKKKSPQVGPTAMSFAAYKEAQQLSSRRKEDDESKEAKTQAQAPPSKMEADANHPEGELVLLKAGEGESIAAETKTKAGAGTGGGGSKKKDKKGGNKVVMRWG